MINSSPPDFVYAIVGTQVVLFSSFAIPILVFQSSQSLARYYWMTELIYATLSLVSKCTLNGLLLANVFVISRGNFRL